MAKKPNLAYELGQKFAAAWEAQHGSPYRLTPKDRSQLGRWLNPGGGRPGPSELELATFEVVCVAYVADPDDFLEKQGWSLAYLLTSGGANKYRAKRVNGHGLSQKDRKFMAGSEEFIRRKQQEASRDGK